MTDYLGCSKEGETKAVKSAAQNDFVGLNKRLFDCVYKSSEDAETKADFVANVQQGASKSGSRILPELTVTDDDSARGGTVGYTIRDKGK